MFRGGDAFDFQSQLCSKDSKGLLRSPWVRLLPLDQSRAWTWSLATSVLRPPVCLGHWISVMPITRDAEATQRSGLRTSSKLSLRRMEFKQAPTLWASSLSLGLESQVSRATETSSWHREELLQSSRGWCLTTTVCQHHVGSDDTNVPGVFWPEERIQADREWPRDGSAAKCCRCSPQCGQRNLECEQSSSKSEDHGKGL